MIINKKVIEKQIDEAQDNDGKYFGLSYEQGIIDALNWILDGDESISLMEQD